MTIQGFDAATFANIPDTADFAFLYADGDYKVTTQQIAERFPRGLRGRWISVLAEADVDIDDCETGAIRVQQLPARITAWDKTHPDGPVKVVYCNRSTLPAVQAACSGLQYRVWLATLDGSTAGEFYSGASLVACQYATVDNAYDVSAIYDPAWASNWLWRP